MAAEPERSVSTSDIAGQRFAGSDAAAGPGAGAADGAAAHRQPLLPAVELDRLRARWEDVQAGFVDEPRSAVADADRLVAEVMQQLADTFARERQQLEGQWDRGERVSTEDLRVGLQRYRSFFNRLLQT